MEIWKPIPSFEGYYEASSLGRVRSVDRVVKHKRCGTQFVRGNLMSLKKSRSGYLMCLIQKDGVRKNMTTHRLIAKTFIPNPKNKPQVNHKNGIKDDNRVENLEWCNRSENINHAYANNLMVKNFGSKNGSSKLNKHQVIEIKKLLDEKNTCVSIAKKFNVSSSQIERIKNKVNWSWV